MRQLNSQSNEEMVDPNQLMNLMSQLMPNSTQTDAIETKLPRFHELFIKKRGWPKHIDKQKCTKFLANSYQHGSSIKMHELNIISESMQCTPYDITARLQGMVDEHRIQWYTSSAPGSVYTRYDETDIFAQLRNYPNDKFYSYSNSTDKTMVFLSNTCHIAIGFCDLRQLCVGMVHSHQNGPLKFVGVDVSAYRILSPIRVTKIPCISV